VLESVSVAAISDDLLSRGKELNDSAPSDLQVGIASSRKGSVGPHDPTRLNGDSDLVPKTRSVQFVGEPLWTERCRLSDWEVGAIESDLAAVSIVLYETIIEADLFRRTDWLINPSGRHGVNLRLRLTTLRSAMACSSGHRWVRKVFSSQFKKLEQTVSVPYDLRKWRSRNR
jgi:hypothetical protein